MKPLATALTICLILVFCAPAQAALEAVRTWDGGVGGSNNWSDVLNWGGTLPNTGDDIVLATGNDMGDDTAIYDAAVQVVNAGPYRHLTLDAFILTINRAPGLEFKGLTTLRGLTTDNDITGSEPLKLCYVDVAENATIDNQSSAAIYALRFSVTATTASRTLTLDNDANAGFYYIKEMILTANGANEAVLVVTADTPNVYIGVLDVAGSNDTDVDELQFNENVRITIGTIFRSGTIEVNVAAGKKVDGGGVTMMAGTYEKEGTGVFHSS